MAVTLAGKAAVWVAVMLAEKAAVWVAVTLAEKAADRATAVCSAATTAVWVAR